MRAYLRDRSYDCCNAAFGKCGAGTEGLRLPAVNRQTKTKSEAWSWDADVTSVSLIVRSTAPLPSVSTSTCPLANRASLLPPAVKAAEPRYLKAPWSKDINII